MTQNSQSQSTLPTLNEQQSQTQKRLPFWRLWVPLLCQTGLILAAPAQPFYTVVTGKTVVLQTVPVDPYDFLRGYSQTLSYDISQTRNFEGLPGSEELKQQQKEDYRSNIPFYVILEAPQQTTPSGLPQAWKPVRVSSSRPTQLPANQVALKGQMRYNSITYGLETYYFPEDRREQINNDISQAQRPLPGQQKQPFVVEVKVDAQGNAVPVSLWVRDRNYRF